MVSQQSIMQKERLHEYFRRHGLEGESAFQALTYHYTHLFPLPTADIPGATTAAWKTAHCKIEDDASVMRYLDEVVGGDKQGHALPDWYGFFVGRRFREGSGKFFTPRPIAQAMAKLLPRISNPIIMDPTCGGGTFLMEASEVWGASECTLVANDLEKSLVEMAMAALSLATPARHEKHYSIANIFDESEAISAWHGRVDYILANPPFSLRIEHEQFESLLFKLGYRNSDALFLDTAYRLLRPGGRLVCLLPHSLIVNQEFSALREAVEKIWRVTAVLCLPEGIFHLNAGTTARADILVLDKEPLADPGGSRVFASIPSVGISLNGQSGGTPSNDLQALLDDTDVKQSLGIN